MYPVDHASVTVTRSLPLFPRPLRWGVVVVAAALIAYWSLVTTPPSLSGWSTAAEPTTDRGAILPSVPPSHERHALAYACLGSTLAYALADAESSTVRKAAIVFLAATGYGALMEVGQWFTPDRVAALGDAVANAVGAAGSLGWYVLERRVRFDPVFSSVDDRRRS